MENASPRLLTDSEIRTRLRNLRGWTHRGRFIVKSYHFKDFVEDMRFLNAVARIAEGYQHHPDIKVRYSTVTLSIQTHSEGGVTTWDVELAKRIEGATSQSRKK